MPIIPHPTKEKAWVISYVQSEEGNASTHKVEFSGALKDALLQERELRAFGRRRSDAV
jgi:hypothetical protein